MNDAALAVNPWIILPFGILLGFIAFVPVRWPAWWLRHYLAVPAGLAIPTLLYYLFALDHGMARIEETAHEYLSFIALVGSLFIVSGGIHIQVRGAGRPFTNAVFLFVGAVLANVLGTTGASMLLVRPWFRMNEERVKAHHVVFFVFIVSNIGGCLTPIGDPPLFLGYLVGVPFWWVARHCFPMWMVAVGLLLAIFWVVDTRDYRQSRKDSSTAKALPLRSWRFEGLANLVFLAIILGAVFLEHPRWLREMVMTGAALGSYFSTGKAIHEANHFDVHPVKEVAVLFAGIFATMMPALDWLQGHAAKFANASTATLFWGSGCLSSVLDNAPTYLCFFKAISSQFIKPGMPPSKADTVSLLADADFNMAIIAISVGAVFFGANTYIGNGPNFMVKSIAEKHKIRMPGFLEYIWKYALPCMGPPLVIVWWIFFRG